MSFEQIRVFMGLDASGVAKGLAKARAMVASQGKEMGAAAAGSGAGGLLKILKTPLTSLIAAPVAIAAGLRAAGERAQHLRDMAQETGLALDAGTRNAAALGDRVTAVGNLSKKAWAWYSDLFERGLQTMGASKDTSAARDASQRGAAANTGRDRAVQDARVAAAEAILLADDKILHKEKEIAMLNRRQVEDKKTISEIDQSTDAGAQLAGKMQGDVNSRNLQIIQKTGALEAERVQRSREISASEQAIWETEKQRYEINATQGQKMQAMALQANNLEQKKAEYAGDVVKQNELQNQANQIRNEMLAKEKEFKSQILEIDQQAATQAVSIMLNNDLKMVELLKQQAAQHRAVAATLRDEVEVKQALARAQEKENQAVQIYRAMRSRALSDEATLLGLRRQFVSIGETIFATDISRAKLLREQAEDAIRMAGLEKDRETRAQKLLAAQGLMNQAIAAELKTRTSISGLSDIADPKNRTERGRAARKAQQLYSEAQSLEARGNFAEADKRRGRAQQIEEGLMATSRGRLSGKINPNDAKAGQEAKKIFDDMRKELKDISKKLDPVKV